MPDQLIIATEAEVAAYRARIAVLEATLREVLRSFTRTGKWARATAGPTAMGRWHDTLDGGGK
jgi:hypothetical protein